MSSLAETTVTFTSILAMPQVACIILILLLFKVADLARTSNETEASRAQRTTSAPEILVNEEDDYLASSSDLHQLRKSFSEAFRRQSKQLDEISDLLKTLLSRHGNKTIKETAACPRPWLKYKHMCLYSSIAKMTWIEAEELCKTKGGFLVWFKNKMEHLTVNTFLETKPQIHIFHVGLHRISFNKPLQWTSGASTAYRGDPLIDPKETQFSALKGTTLIDGDDKTYLLPFLCRR